MIATVLLLILVACKKDTQTESSHTDPPSANVNIMQKYSITDPYDYASIMSSGWGVVSRAERGAKLVIPKEIYTNMTTEALLKSIVSYPFLIDMQAFEIWRIGFLILYEERRELYPVINELVQRDDFAITLIKEYKETPVIDTEWNYSTGYRRAKTFILETGYQKEWSIY